MAERRSTLVRVVWLASARTGYRGGVTVTALDHIALWADDRTALAAFLCDIAGLREIERTERFTLIGGDPREGKLTLIAAKSGVTVISLKDGGKAVVNPSAPLSAYLAYPDENVQIEVFDPRPGMAAKIVTSGMIVSLE